MRRRPGCARKRQRYKSRLRQTIVFEFFFWLAYGRRTTLVWPDFALSVPSRSQARSILPLFLMEPLFSRHKQAAKRLHHEDAADGARQGAMRPVKPFVAAN